MINSEGLKEQKCRIQQHLVVRLTRGAKHRHHANRRSTIRQIQADTYKFCCRATI